MLSSLFDTFQRLLAAVPSKPHRALFTHFSIQSRLTGVIGPRGTGKTTLLLQYIRERLPEPDRVLYISLDTILLASTTLLSLVDELYEYHGIRYLFLDEVHKYPAWNQELKNIYDSYPDLYVVFSGSSTIDLVKGSYDLSRRAVLYRLDGLSFREYVSFSEGLELPVLEYQSLLSAGDQAIASIAGLEGIKAKFRRYLRYGYYPFFLEGEAAYQQKILRILEKTVYEDIPNYYRLKTENLVAFKRILAYVATIPPGELNINSIAKQIRLDHKTVQHYLSIMEETGLVRLVRSEGGGSRMLKGAEKIFLDNPNLYQAVAEETGHRASTGSIREIFFLSMLSNAGMTAHHSRIGDFLVGETVFEIGGRQKSLKQIRQKLDNSYLVKDDILRGSRYEIPLYLFGFLY